MLTRRVQLNLKDVNDSKLDQLDKFMEESLRVVNVFIDMLWSQKRFKGKYVSLKTDTWLSAAMQQALSKQALGTVKSQRKKHKKTKPVIRKPSIILDQRFLTFKEDVNTFDFWIHLSSLGSKTILNLPAKKHKHFHKFKEDGWTLKKSGRFRKTPKGWFFDIYFEKEVPQKKTEGSDLGVDCGYKKLIACSDKQVKGQELESCYNKISRKQQGSKAFKRALKERDNLINQSVNNLSLTDVKQVIVENLKDVKKNSKGRIRKSFNNKLQRWSYSKVLDKLSRVCEEAGIDFVKVNPRYTSQTCSFCGRVDKNSRKNEEFLCTRCGMKMDADINASRNILMRGAYSPPSPTAFC